MRLRDFRTQAIAPYRGVIHNWKESVMNEEKIKGFQHSNQDQHTECRNKKIGRSTESKILIKNSNNKAEVSVSEISAIKKGTDGDKESDGDKEPVLAFDLKEDLSISKYFKMAQVGIPIQAVISKMKLWV